MIIYKGKIRDRFSLKYVNFIVMVILVGAFIAFNGMLTTDTPHEDVLVSDNSPAQTIDISGDWVGVITEDYGVENRYEYTITFDQTGNTLEGIGIQDTTTEMMDIYAESSLVGDVDGTTVYFYEVSTDVLENLTLDQWCRIEVFLEYQVVEGQEMLIGTWDTAEEDRVGCTTTDGRVILTRE